MKKEPWQIFKLKGKEIARYPIRDFPGRREEMRAHFAEAHGCRKEDITTEVAKR